MDEERIAPLAAADREPRTEELLRSMRISDATDDLNIFATLAHNPRLLKHWSGFAGAILFGGTLPERDREVLILRTAVNCRADYEWGHHLTIGATAGLTEDEMSALATPDGGDTDPLLVRTADELHSESVLSDQTWAALAERYHEAQLIEVCMVVGQYHLVAFTLRSLGVQPEPGVASLPR